jgi:uncharacterized protein YwqG
MRKLTTRTPSHNLEASFQWLRGKGRETIRLHPRENSNLSFSDSKVGGLVLWRDNETWPHCQQHNSDYVPVLQVHSNDILGIAFPPNTDLLQVLWCPNDHEECGCCPKIKLYWWRSESLNPHPLNPKRIKAENEEYLPKSCEVSPERVVEYPSAFSLSDDQTKELSDWQQDDGALYQYSLSVAPGFKIGGYPNWVQDSEKVTCDCGLEMDYLLTIDSAEFDGGTHERWLPEEEREIWNAEYETRNRVQCAAGLMLGDMGNINVFICRACTPWSFRWIFQCS